MKLKLLISLSFLLAGSNLAFSETLANISIDSLSRTTYSQWPGVTSGDIVGIRASGQFNDDQLATPGQLQVTAEFEGKAPEHNGVIEVNVDFKVMRDHSPSHRLPTSWHGSTRDLLNQVNIYLTSPDGTRTRMNPTTVGCNLVITGITGRDGCSVRFVFEDGTGGITYWIDFNKTIIGTPWRVGDINHDERLDFADFLILSENFGKEGTLREGDINGDGVINFPDFLHLAREFPSFLVDRR